MAKALWLLQKADINTPNKRTVNGIVAMLMNIDDAQTEAQAKAAAVAKLVAAGHKVKSNYFTSAAIVTDLTSGPLKDNLDAYAISTYNTAIALGAGA